jgi:acetyl-CoA acyltransferase
MSSLLIKVSNASSRASALLSHHHTTKSYQATKSFFSTHNAKTNVVIVDGVRLPFAMASTIYQDEMAVDLQRLAFKGLIDKTAIEKKDIDYVISGTVIQEVRTSNIAREAAINAGIPNSVGGHTVSMACISSNAAICAAADKIRTGHASAVLAGGTETFSDVPIRLTRPMRQKLITLPKAMKKGGTLGAVRHMLGLKVRDAFALETPAIANYTTGEVMGVSSDRLSAKFGILREDQDVFTVRSHTMAAKAHLDG